MSAAVPARLGALLESVRVEAFGPSWNAVAAVGAGLLVLLLRRWLSRRHAKRRMRRCWFCRYDVVYVEGGGSAACPACGQPNAFAPDGDYQRRPPGMRDASLNSPSPAVRAGWVEPTNVLCAPCTRNQELLVQGLASFKPSTMAHRPSNPRARAEDDDAAAYRRFRERLEAIYPICPRCQHNVRAELERKNRALQVRWFGAHVPPDGPGDSSGTAAAGVSRGSLPRSSSATALLTSAVRTPDLWRRTPGVGESEPLWRSRPPTPTSSAPPHVGLPRSASWSSRPASAAASSGAVPLGLPPGPPASALPTHADARDPTRPDSKEHAGVQPVTRGIWSLSIEDERRPRSAAAAAAAARDDEYDDDGGPFGPSMPPPNTGLHELSGRGGSPTAAGTPLGLRGPFDDNARIQDVRQGDADTRLATRSTDGGKKNIFKAAPNSTLGSRARKRNYAAVAWLGLLVVALVSGALWLRDSHFAELSL